MRLKPLQVEGFPTPIEIQDGRLTLGRSEDNDVRLPPEDFPSVSQHHTRITIEGEDVWVEDLGSKNGTLVNGKSVERAQVMAGDVVQLGAIGPRFVVVGSSPLIETMFVDPKKMGLPHAQADLTESAVVDIKNALGLPHHLGVEELVHSRTRRTAVLLGILVTVMLGAGVWHLTQRGREGEQRFSDGLAETQRKSGEEIAQVRLEYERQLQALANENDRLSLIVGELSETETERESAVTQMRATFESSKRELQGEREMLQSRLQKLEADGGASHTEIVDLQEELALARDRLSRLDPVNLRQARLSTVARVRSTIVLLETKLMLRDNVSGELLHVANSGGVELPNFDRLGTVWTQESTGSGFCVSPEGWILSNAHVVTADKNDPMLLAASTLEPVVEVQAVFSGESKRHSVDVVTVADGINEDLALVKIEPFPGMPYLAGFDLDAPMPDPASDVYLFGFPLGNFALQQGETVIASTFRGILSRVVDNYMQVDAGVHPGNSGGPVTDATGRVIGIVFSVQAMPDQSAVYTIGYAIPIAEARKVWPPPADYRMSPAQMVPNESTSTPPGSHSGPTAAGASTKDE